MLMQSYYCQFETNLHLLNLHQTKLKIKNHQTRDVNRFRQLITKDDIIYFCKTYSNYLNLNHLN